ARPQNKRDRMKDSRRGFLRSLYAASYTVAADHLAAWVQLSAGPYFVDVTRAAGLNKPNVCGDAKQKKHLLETTGCGVAFFDYDHDGWLDLFFVNSTTFRPPDSGAQPTNCLFHNNRDGTFTEVTEKAGLVRTGWGQGCCIGDYDNDGFDDLF